MQFRLRAELKASPKPCFLGGRRTELTNAPGEKLNLDVNNALMHVMWHQLCGWKQICAAAGLQTAPLSNGNYKLWIGASYSNSE